MATSAAGYADGHGLLEITRVTVSGESAHADLVYGSMRADPGDLVLIQVTDLREAELWGDLATGMVDPIEGRVAVLGNDLSELDVDSGNWLRGRIGRVFSRGNWMDRLSLLDNVLLPARHHSDREFEVLRSEASTLAASFGMPGIPLGMPDSIPRLDLQRAACVRAFLGRPMLVILEDPTYAAHELLRVPLMNAIRAARDKGAAVLWFTPSSDVWRDRSIPASRRYRMAGNELMEVGIR